MPISKEEFSRQLAAIEYRHTCCNGPELRHLPKVLREGERLRTLARCVHDGTRWLACVTDQRLLLLDKGWFYGLKMVELPAREIQSIHQKTQAFSGELAITTASGTRRIARLRRRAALVIADTLSQQIAALGARAAPADPAAAGTEERLSSLERLQKLRDSGVLTPEEFAAEKEKILRQR